MKNFKVFLIVVAVSVGFLLSGQPVVHAGDTLTLWPIVPGVRGDISKGCLTIYYEKTGYECCDGDTGVRIYFFLRLYEKQTKEWHLITAVDNGPPAQSGPYCLILDVDSGKQQQALIRFFNNSVLPSLDPTGGYTSVQLKDVDNWYFNGSAPHSVVADIVLVAN
jgi:hypothetical protein